MWITSATVADFFTVFARAGEEQRLTIFLVEKSAPGLTVGRTIEKMRWKLGPWELDRFMGALDGLALLEIELVAEDDPLPESPQGVQILREVTDDKRFVSAVLAKMTPKKQRKLVKKAYKEVKGWKGLSD